MDRMHIANGLVSLLCALALTWVVLHPKIREGLLIKTGLVLMIFSLVSSVAWSFGTRYEDWHALWRSGFTLRLGLLLVALGIVHKAYIAPFGGFGRRPTDWMALRRKLRSARR